MLIAAFAAFALSAGFTVTGALLGPVSAPYAYAYATPPYAPADFAPQPPYPPHPFVPPPGVKPPIARTTPPVALAAAAPVVAAPVAPPPLTASGIEQIARNLRQAGEAGRRVNVIGTAPNAGTTYAAISLARALAKDTNVVLVDVAFGAPNLSVISTDPQAPGLAELIRGAASFGDIITKDQYSNVHLVATGNVGNDAAALAAAPMVATAIEALARSYDHVVIDAGSATDVAIEYFAPLAPRAVLVAANPAAASTRVEHGRLMAAGFADVTLLPGAPQAAAA